MIEAIQNFDTDVLLYIQNHIRFAFLNIIMIFFTLLGNSGFIWVATSILLLIFPKTRRSGFDVLICLLAAYIINDLILKILVSRPRPYATIESLSILIKPLSSYSFPSGHSSSSFAAALALTLSFGKKGALSYIPAIIIAFSRCYVGVHYPSDVIAGAVVGTLVSLAAFTLLKKYVKTDFIPKK